MTRTGEKGVALVFTLFLMAALSAMAVSLMFLAQTETSASRNYRTMSQARYAGEAGVHRALNYLSSPAYAATVAGVGGYDVSTSPVKYSGADVVLSAVSGTSSNYPDPAVVSAFNSAAQGTLAVGSGTVTYAATAKLLSMRAVNIYGGASGVLQTWQITAVGTVPGAMPAIVEVSAIMERDYSSAQTYAIFATGAGCGAIDLRGNMHTDSYDSANLVSGAPSIQTSGGAVGTNGNLAISGHVGVQGNLDTPRTGVGDCNTGTPTALSSTGSATVSGSVVRLPQAKTYPPPDAPSPTPPTTTTWGSVAASLTWCTSFMSFNPGAACTYSGNSVTITSAGATPILMGNATLGSNVDLTIRYGSSFGVAGTGTVALNVNSFKMGANSSLALGTGASVVMNVAGTSLPSGTNPVDFTGGPLLNGSYDSSKFQILYAGTGDLEINGGGSFAATIYAPNAKVTMEGGSDFYGSILSNSFQDNGGVNVHYDTRLSTKFFTLGNYVMSSFSWKKY